MRETTIEVETRYLSLFQTPVIEGMINVYHSITGTGKTTLLNDYVRSRGDVNMLAIVSRRTLATFISEKLGFENYLNSKRSCLLERGRPSKWVVCINSLQRYCYSDGAKPIPDVLIIDEIGLLFEHYISETLTRGRRSLFVDLFGFFLRQLSTSVIICDAYWNDYDKRVIQDLIEGTDKKMRIYRNTYCQSMKQLFITHSANEWDQQLMEELDMMGKPGEDNPPRSLYIFSNSKEILVGIYRRIKNRLMDIMKDEESVNALGIVLLTGESRQEIKDYFSMKPNESWNGKRIIMSTPTIAAGVSFDLKWFDRVMGFAINTTSSPRSLLQQMNRVRKVKDNRFDLYIPRDMEGIKEYTYEEVFHDLSLIQEWLGYQYDQVVDIGHSIREVDNGVELIPSLKKDSVNNRLVVMNLLERLHYKRSYFNVMKKLLDNDWFEWFRDDEDPSSDSFSLLRYQELGKETDKESLTQEAVNPVEHQIMIDDKNLVSDDSKVVRLLEFYNVFPPYGSLKFRSGYKLNSDRTGIFLAKYEKPYLQRNFEKIFMTFEFYDILFDDGAQYEKMGTEPTTYIRNIMLRLFRMSGIIKDDDIVIPQKGRRYAPYELIDKEEPRESVAISTKFTISSYSDNASRSFVIDERQILENWTTISDIIAENLTILELIIPGELVAILFRDNFPKTQVGITAMTNFICGLLKYIGLTCKEEGKKKKKPLSSHKVRIKGGPRVNVRVYRVRGIPDRLFLGVCRVCTPEYRDKHTLITRITPDPFNLLEDEGTLLEEGNKFYSYYLDVEEKRRGTLPTICRITNE